MPDADNVGCKHFIPDLRIMSLTKEGTEWKLMLKCLRCFRIWDLRE